MLSDEEKKLAARLSGSAMQNAKPLRYAKSTERAVVPQNLREFLLDVHRRIEAGDEGTIIPSDDLLQGERAHGGLVEGKDRYSFVYFPERGTSIRWDRVTYGVRPAAIEVIAILHRRQDLATHVSG